MSLKVTWWWVGWVDQLLQSSGPQWLDLFVAFAWALLWHSLRVSVAER